MTTPPIPPPDDGPARRPAPALWDEFRRAPLVPVALAATVGLIADRYVGASLEAGLLTAVVGVVCWAILRWRSVVASWPLWVSFAGLAAAYHHTHRTVFAADDIGEVATTDPRLARVRGVLVEDPVTRYAPKGEPLSPGHRPDHDATVLRLTAVAAKGGGWLPASGLARLTVEREPESRGRPPLAGLRAGDTVEVVGLLSRPRPPGNPGERDYAAYLLDQRTRAELRVSDTSAAVTRIETGRPSAAGTVAAAHRNASAALTDNLPPGESAVAVALLLGDGSAMDRSEWDAYIRTGVVHALAISGQHLAVLAGFLWIGLRTFGVSRRRGAWLVLLVIVGYAILTGLRPSGVRAAAMVAAACGGLIVGRPYLPANAFALGWLAVVALNPTDPFTLGCQLSFVSVFVLVWGLGRWFRPPPLTPLEQLIDESRPVWVKLVRSAARAVGVLYGITLVIWLANLPLLAADQHLVSPVGLVIGPPVVVLTSVALVAGFFVMLLSPFGPLAAPFALATEWSLAGCGWLVHAADRFPGGSVYTPGPPGWWLVGFYLGLAAVVLVGPGWRGRAAVGLAGWALLGAVTPTGGGRSDELRVTFLAVGSGGCTVIETPDGRCLLYDVGSTAGPSAVRRVVAPYLWSRGVRRIDEVFVSHADTDHFNGIAELVRRFPVGQVTLTPSFAEKPTAQVAEALTLLAAAGVPTRVAVAGQRYTAGAVEVEVLHPPVLGPPGIENERSMVLLVRHAGHTILLTGDLERAGTGWVTGQPPRQAHVLMAPHHGSRAALPRRLVDWADPKLIVVSRGPARGNTVSRADAGPDRPVWDTFDSGAVTLRSHPTGLVAEAFRTGDRQVLVRGP